MGRRIHEGLILRSKSMKKSVFLLAIAVSAFNLLFAARDPSFVDPNEYGDYKKAMASNPDFPMAVEWQNTNNACLLKIDDAWCAKQFSMGESNLSQLLDEVKGAYNSDAMVLTKIATLTQYAMVCKAPWWTFGIRRSEERLLWTKLLLEKAANSADNYIKMFMIDQLRWCAFSSQAQAIKDIAKNASDKGVESIACMAIREISK
jgi:hypothetical protein